MSKLSHCHIALFISLYHFTSTFTKVESLCSFCIMLVKWNLWSLYNWLTIIHVVLLLLLLIRISICHILLLRYWLSRMQGLNELLCSWILVKIRILSKGIKRHILIARIISLESKTMRNVLWILHRWLTVFLVLRKVIWIIQFTLNVMENWLNTQINLSVDF